MNEQNQLGILDKIKVIGKRRLVQKLIDALSLALFVSGIVVVLGILIGDCIGIRCFCLGITLGCIAGIFIALLQRPTLDDTAGLIDRSQSLADRVTTSVQILKKTQTNEIEQLQLADTRECLARIQPETVIALRTPRILFAAITVYTFAAVLDCMTIPAKRELSGDICDKPPVVNNVLLNKTSKKDPATCQECQPLSDMTKNKISTAIDQAARAVPKDHTLRALEETIKALMKKLSTSEASLREHIAAWTELETALDAITQRLISADSNTKDTKHSSDASKPNRPDTSSRKPSGPPSNGTPEKTAEDSTVDHAARHDTAMIIDQRQTAINTMNEASTLVAFEKAAFIESQTGNENWSRESGSEPLSSVSQRSIQSQNVKTRIEQVSGLPGKGPSQREKVFGRETIETENEVHRRYKEVQARCEKEIGRAMENQTIPISQQQMLRNYFDSLEEKNAKR